MKKIVFYVLCAIAFPVAAQDTYEAVFAQIETNSVTLEKKRSERLAEQLAARTGLLPSGPEVAVNLLQGPQSGAGNRTDFAVSQTFDFPSLYRHRGRIADLEGRLAEEKYRATLFGVLLEAQKQCIELVYFTAQSRAAARRREKA
jgi:hypothetical protein